MGERKAPRTVARNKRFENEKAINPGDESPSSRESTPLQMKKKSNSQAAPARIITDDEIRDYAYHLYQQSGCIPGHDVENWLEAQACLEASIPREHSHTRLHRHRHSHAAAPSAAVPTIVTLESDSPDELEVVGAVVIEKILPGQSVRTARR